MPGWKQQVRKPKKETYVIYLACKDSRVPWYARALAQSSLLMPSVHRLDSRRDLHRLSDDLILVPLGIALVLKMIPPPVLAECRELETVIAQVNPQAG